MYQDFTKDNYKRLWLGATGTGKTTHALAELKREIRKGRFDYIFIFDPERQWASRMGCQAADRLDYAVAALEQSGGVCFDPTGLFQGNTIAAAEWFCEWAWNFSGTIPGDKLIVLDDFPDYLPQSNAKYLAHPISRIMGAGRRRGLDVMALARMVTEACPLMRGNFSDYYAFQQPDETCQKNVAGFGYKLEAVKKLLPGHFLYLQKATGNVLPGKIKLPGKR